MHVFVGQELVTFLPPLKTTTFSAYAKVEINWNIFEDGDCNVPETV